MFANTLVKVAAGNCLFVIIWHFKSDFWNSISFKLKISRETKISNKTEGSEKDKVDDNINKSVN